MNILVTGFSGFLGNALANANSTFRHNIIGLGRNNLNKINCNLKFNIPKIPKDTEIIIHAAGKAHINPKSESEIIDFFDVNYNGTKNLINGIIKSKVKIKQFVFISSVAVYGLDNGLLIDEKTPLLGSSPYAKSKILSENFLISWARKQKIPLLILRLPLLVGKNPKGNLLKLMNSIRKYRHITIKDNKAKKSMLLVDDVANFLLMQNLSEGTYNLAGPRNYYVAELEAALEKYYSSKILLNLPKCAIKFAAKIGDYIHFFPINTELYLKLTSDLTFSDEKARKQINWNSNDVINFFKSNQNN